MATLRQKTSFGPGIYRGHTFDVDRLRSFVDGTNKAIAAGVPIPLLKLHAPINASDEATTQFAADQGAGWVKKLELDPDGHITWEADSVPDSIVEAVNGGQIKFTSPEFRPHYSSEKAGVYEGPIVRHFAFVPKPGNPQQGAIETVALAECFQLSEADYEGPVDTQHGENEGMSQILTSSGYVHKGSGNYHHPEGHTVKLSKDGSWSHTGTGKRKRVTSGHGEKGMADHLSDVHDDNQHAERTDDSYTGSGNYPKHEDASMPATGQGASIDESTLLNDDEEFVTDKDGKKVKRKKPKVGLNEQEKAIHEQPNQGEAAPTGSQHEEADDTQHAEKHEIEAAHTALKTHGWRNKAPSSNLSYVHKDHPDHELHITKNGNYNHEVKGKTKFSGAASTITHHLKTFHGGGYSQHAESYDVTPTDTTVSRQDSATPVGPNPDMPPVASDRSKMQAVIAGLAQKNIVLPSDFDFGNPAAIDILIGCINSSIKAEQEAEANAEPISEEPPPQDAAMPFAEEEEDESLQFASLGELSTGTRYRVVRRSAKAPSSGGGKYRRAVHVRVYDTHHKDYTGKGKAGLVKEWPNVDSRYEGHKSEHGKALHAAHSHAAELNAKHEGETGASQHSEAPIQFTEEELNALPEKARAAIKAGQVALEAERKAKVEAEAQAAQFAEQERVTRNTAARDKAKAAIKAATLPPVIRAQLLSAYDTEGTVQFAEGVEQPLYTAQQVADMVSKAIPKSMQFLEDDVFNSDPPKPGKVQVGVDAAGNPVYQNGRTEQFFEQPAEGEMIGHVSAEQAEAIVNNNPAFKQFARQGAPTSIADNVATQAVKNPSRVMNN